VAYEVSEAKWGKDTGPYDQEGVGLYRNHNAGVRVFQGANVSRPDAAGLRRVLPMSANPPAAATKKGGKKKQQQPADEHDPTAPRMGQAALNSFPRIA